MLNITNLRIYGILFFVFGTSSALLCMWMLVGELPIAPFDMVFSNLGIGLPFTLLLSSQLLAYKIMEYNLSDLSEGKLIFFALLFGLAFCLLTLLIVALSYSILFA